MRSYDDIRNKIRKPDMEELPAPGYNGSSSGGIFLGTESMSRHTADAGWQLTLGFQEGGYTLVGHRLEVPRTDVREILPSLSPGVVVMQDKREWFGQTAGQKGRNIQERFQHVEDLRERPNIFRLTILKDAQQKPGFHRDSAAEIGAHAWVTYYHPRIVTHVAPYVREAHLVRTYHTIDRNAVPPFQGRRMERGIVSGAISKAYPIRKILRQSISDSPYLDYKKHPGYEAKRCRTNEYLQCLSRYRVAICTSSRYGYALRKIIEATACGCIVITDLPIDDILPGIDGNLVRLESSNPILECRKLIPELIHGYDPERQEHYAREARTFYDYRVMGRRLVTHIENLRRHYKET